MEQEGGPGWVFAILLVIAACAIASCLALASMESKLAVASFDSPLQTPTPHPPCPPDYTPAACDAAWASLPPCNYSACPLGCVSSIYCVECDGLNCWANPTPWYTNTLNIPVPQGPVARTWRAFIPLVVK